jgi:ribonucleotide monophosphatase NagD (HAD superfamily)
MDSGAFLNAIKYATDCEIKLLGKPGISFFKAGLKMSNYDGKEEKWMIGDDLIGDIEGGKNTGCTSFLTLTGKTSSEDLEASKIKPDYVINSIEDIIQYLVK